MQFLLDLLKNPAGLALIAYVVVTLISGGKIDVGKILEFIQRIIAPTVAAEKAAERTRKIEQSRVLNELEAFVADGDTEGEQLARKRLDRLLKRK